MIIVLCVVGVIALFAIMIKQLVSGNEFRDGAQQIIVGMSMQEVESIMGQPSYTKTHNVKSIEYIYEKSECKGFVRGDTKVRRTEIVFSPDKKVISIGKNSNCDMSGW